MTYSDRPWFEHDLPEADWPYPKGTEVVCRWPGSSTKDYGVVYKCVFHDYRIRPIYIQIVIDLHGGGRWGLGESDVWPATPLEALAQIEDD